MSGNSLRSLNRSGERVGVVVDFHTRRKVRSTTLTGSRRARARGLSHSEIRIARWLSDHLHCAGALALVEEYGGTAVIEALHDEEIVQWCEYSHPKPGDPRRGYSRINPELHRPGGFLRFVLRGGV